MSGKRIPNCAKCGESIKKMGPDGTLTNKFRFGRLVVRCGWHGDCMDDEVLNFGDSGRIWDGKSTEQIVAMLREIRERGPDRVLGTLPGDMEQRKERE